MKKNNDRHWFREEATLQTLSVMRKMAHSLEGMNRALQNIERRGILERPAEPAEREPPILRRLFDKAWPKK